MTLVHTDVSKDILKRYEEPWKKKRGLIRSITNNSGNYDEKYMKIKFNSNDDLDLKKTLKLYNMIIVLGFCFSWKQQILSTIFLRWMFV